MTAIHTPSALKPPWAYSLKDELLCEDRVLTLPWVSLGYLYAVQVDVAVRVGEILVGKFMRLFHVKDQAANLQEKNKQSELKIKMVEVIEMKGLCVKSFILGHSRVSGTVVGTPEFNPHMRWSGIFPCL